MSLEVTQQDRHEVANRIQNSPAGVLDPGAALLIISGWCPGCGGSAAEFRDDLSLREFRISGLCQSCQDSVFGSEDGEAIEVPTDPEQFSELEDVNWNELD